jgi:hypothetical protein
MIFIEKHDYAGLENRQRGPIDKVATRHSGESRNPENTADKLNTVIAAYLLY